MSSHSYPVRQGVTSYGQDYKGFPIQPLLEAPCKGGYGVLSCVRLYFLLPYYQANTASYSIVIYALLHIVLGTRVGTAEGWFFLLTAAVQQIPPVTLVPRFILGLRELYAPGRQASGIDSAFSAASERGHGAVPSTIVFANPGRNEGEESDDIPLEDAVWQVRRGVMERVRVLQPASRPSVSFLPSLAFMPSTAHSKSRV